jgi:hypothetical protein
MHNIVVDVQTGESRAVDLTAEEIQERALYVQNEFPAAQWEDLRRKRRDLLTETDYLALADSTLTDEMRSYRQALRDLPANTVDPANPVWPVKPGGN